MIHQKRLLTQLATYCSSCSDELLFFPCHGFAEVRVIFSVDENWVIWDPEVTDVSKRDDGINWDSCELSEEISSIPFSLNAIISGNQLWGPENVFTIYDSALKNVNMDSLVRYDGTIDSDILDVAREQYDRFVKVMSDSGYDEGAFTDYVNE